jgi:hypothetical protein
MKHVAENFFVLLLLGPLQLFWAFQLMFAPMEIVNLII